MEEGVRAKKLLFYFPCVFRPVKKLKSHELLIRHKDAMSCLSLSRLSFVHLF